MTIESAKQHVQEVLAKTKITDLPAPEKPLLSIKGDEPLTDAFQKLLSSGVLSAPVSKPAPHAGYVGLLDVRALVSSVVQLHEMNATENFKERANLGDYVSQLSQIASKPGSHTDHLAVWTPAYVAKINPVKTVNNDATLLDVGKKMASGVRRVAVVDDDGSIHRIISQSYVIRQISGAGSDSMKAVSIKDLNLGVKDVVKCSVEQPAIEALKLINKHNVSAVAIVDGSGKLVSQVSGKELTSFLSSRHLEELAKPLSEYLGNPSPASGEAISVTPDVSLSEVFAKFENSKSHRLFVVENGAIVGVVSLRDVIAVLLA